MIYKIVNLRDYYPNLKCDVNLHIYCPDNYEEIDINRTRPGILVLPGGGYYNVSKREGEIVALRFLGYDIACFCLDYSTASKVEHPYPLIEGYAAIDYIRKNAEKYHVDTNNINVMGFSAGGHMASTLAIYRYSELIKKWFNKELDVEINGLILGYPVIVMDEDSKKLGTWKNLVSKDPDNLINFYSVNLHVDKLFPRTFIFACKNDSWLPSYHTMTLIEKLKENNIEHESIIYDGTVHGTSLGDATVYEDDYDISKVNNTQDWYMKAIDFIRRR